MNKAAWTCVCISLMFVAIGAFIGYAMPNIPKSVVIHQTVWDREELAVPIAFTGDDHCSGKSEYDQVTLKCGSTTSGAVTERGVLYNDQGFWAGRNVTLTWQSNTLPNPLTALAVSHDQRYIFMASAGMIAVEDQQAFKKECYGQVHSNRGWFAEKPGQVALAAAFSRDGKLVYVGLNHGKECGKIAVFDTKTGAFVRSFSEGPAIVQLGFKDGGTLVALRARGSSAGITTWKPVKDGFAKPVFDPFDYTKYVFSADCGRVVNLEERCPTAYRQFSEKNHWRAATVSKLGDEIAICLSDRVAVYGYDRRKFYLVKEIMVKDPRRVVLSPMHSVLAVSTPDGVQAIRY